MHLAYTREQEKLRSELRAYFAGLMTPELRCGLADAGGAGRMGRECMERCG